MGPSPWLIAPLALVAAGAAYAGWRLLSGLRVTPKDRERRRRLKLNELGRPHDGLLTDRDGDLVHYCYEIHGVSYTASQDISDLRDRVPEDSARIAGPVTLKYLVRNPANSIIICEKWSGMRIREQTPNGDSNESTA